MNNASRKTVRFLPWLFSLVTVFWTNGTTADDDLRQQAGMLFAALAPITAEEKNDPRVVLGRALFWDQSLSLDGETACASCHMIADWGADRRLRSVDARGNLTRRHSQSVFNSQAAAAGLRWLADRPDGAAQARGSVTGSMGFADGHELVSALHAGNYAPLFAAAFPDQAQPVSGDTYSLALQAYQQTLRTPAPFDRWLQGDDNAMSDAQLRGLRRFVASGCSGCHDGALFGGDRLARFGVISDYRPLTGSGGEDTGLMLVSGDEADKDVFRIQPLRNVAETAPYFHDGSIPTLEKAVAVMAQVQLGYTPDFSAIADLVAFLKSLSGEVPTHFGPP